MCEYNQKTDIHGMFENQHNSAPKLDVGHHVLAPTKYKLRTALIFVDFIAVVVYVYLVLFAAIINDILNNRFSFVSRTMLALYSVLGVSIALFIFILVFKKDKNARSRLKRENQLRADEAVKIWLSGFDWGWPILFVPTMILMTAGGLIGLILNLIAKDASAVVGIQQFIGGVMIVFGALNAAVVIFKLNPKSLAVIAAAFLVTILIMLLYSTSSFFGFVRFFRHFGVANDPLGYLLLAYIWFVFLRLIWLKGMFFYWLLLPNRLELQSGLRESNDVIDLGDVRCKADTSDIILSWFDIGTVTFHFRGIDKAPVQGLIFGIRKKTDYIKRIMNP